MRIETFDRQRMQMVVIKLEVLHDKNKLMSQAIIDNLKPLIKEAREKSMWLFCSYQEIWLSPDDLEKNNKEGGFLWGAVNWQLRDPRERLLQLKQAALNAEKYAIEFESKLK